MGPALQEGRQDMTREDIKGGLLVLAAVLLGSCIDGIVNALFGALGF